ncbi:MAG: SPOR domain-containing protein [Stagnimonas sp.]|nr:SPOR domain-containing protein [Stagnimonas sp.]
MSEAATQPNPSLDTRAIVHRRLVGLAVLLLVLFLLSLLLRTGNRSGDDLPSVVIALNSSGATVDPVTSSMAPTLDAPETEVTEQEAPAPSQAEPVAAAVVETPKPAAPVRPTPPPVTAAAKPREKPAAKPAAPAPLPSAAVKSADARRWFVVIGSYKDPMAAQAIANRVKLAGLKAAATPITAAGEKLHRVRAGPFASKDDAESARATLIVEGLTKATIVGEK